MPRKGPIPRREVLPDPIYGSRLAARFVNRLMYDGKKGAAEKIFYGALEVLAEKTGEEALRAFEKALENVKPHLEVKARRVGGATYQVPMEVRPDRQVSLSIRWLITYARSRGEKGMSNKLAAELLDAFNSRGGAVKKKPFCEIQKNRMAVRLFTNSHAAFTFLDEFCCVLCADRAPLNL